MSNTNINKINQQVDTIKTRIKKITEEYKKITQSLTIKNNSNLINQFKRLTHWEDVDNDVDSYQNAAIDVLIKLGVKIPSKLNFGTCTDSLIRIKRPTTPALLAYHILYDKLKSFSKKTYTIRLAKGHSPISNMNTWIDLYDIAPRSILDLCNLSEIKATVYFNNKNELCSNIIDCDFYLLDVKLYKNIIKTKKQEVANFKRQLETELLTKFPKLILNKL